jgi:beta-phosphoglucomutase-like phosphatase (HAD superfamily)
MIEHYAAYSGLVFDLDGTLVDTMSSHYVAWQAALQPHGLVFSEERFYALGGVHAEAIIRLLAEEQGKSVDAVALAADKEARFVAGITKVEPIKPVLKIAERYRGEIPMAIATGSPLWLAHKMLKSLGILDWFQAIVGAESVAHPKPAPDCFLRAAELIGVAPGSCHAFEDAELGMLAAQRAGMQVTNVDTLIQAERACSQVKGCGSD